MTNGSTEVTQKFLERSDLSQFVAECMEVAEVQLWKPRAEVYLHAAKRLGLQPDQVINSHHLSTAVQISASICAPCKAFD